VFGGYRWRNDLALEASLGSVGDYRLPGRGGIGLMLPDDAASGATSWNLDLYGSWAFSRSLSLYGRLGYSQSEATPVYSTSVAGAIDRRERDGLNYGVGLRYDVTRSLGLKLEYARIGNALNDLGSTALPEGDQVQFGLQFRF
jgi:opacity protein-like surface antigen